MTALDERLITGTATTRPLRRSQHSAESTAAWFALTPRPVAPRYVQVTLRNEDGDILNPEWLKVLQYRVNELLALDQGWDGRHAAAVTDLAVQSLFDVLSRVINDDKARPDIFPLVDGGLQVEWHAAGHDIEIEIEGDGSVFALARTPDGDAVVEAEVGLPVHQKYSAEAEGHLKALQDALAVLTEVVNEAAFA